MTDFSCEHQELSIIDGIVICNLGKFGGAPSVLVCTEHCKGDPEGFEARVRNHKRIKPLCKYLGDDSKTCIDETVSVRECPMVQGGSCRHYLPGKMPECGCGKK